MLCCVGTTCWSSVSVFVTLSPSHPATLLSQAWCGCCSLAAADSAQQQWLHPHQLGACRDFQCTGIRTGCTSGQEVHSLSTKQGICRAVWLQSSYFRLSTTRGKCGEKHSHTVCDDSANSRDHSRTAGYQCWPSVCTEGEWTSCNGSFLADNMLYSWCYCTASCTVYFKNFTLNPWLYLTGPDMSRWYR